MRTLAFYTIIGTLILGFIVGERQQRIAELEERVKLLERQVKILNEELGDRSVNAWDKEKIDPYLNKLVEIEKKLKECCP